MKNMVKNPFRKGIWLAALAVALIFLAALLGTSFAKPQTFTASATDANGKIEILKLDVDVTVREDRQIEIEQSVKVKFNNSHDTMFYQALPLEGDRYYDIVATCPGNDEFYYEVADNPDIEGFMDINCIGGVSRGAVWTYNISYKMEIGVDDVENGMILDVVGFGSSVPLQDVSVTMRFPSAVQTVNGYVGGYGSAEGWGDAEYSLSQDKKTLEIHADELEVVYNSTFGERMAKGITVQFTLADGALQDFTTTRIFTKDLWKILLGGLVVLAAAILLTQFTKKHDEVIPVIHMKPPRDMDPLLLGKSLDANVDNEDITSMIYYFAEKGYLKIDFENQDDPLLISCVYALPNDAPTYQHTLFNGLFAAATTYNVKQPFEECETTTCRAIRVSQLVHKFYYASERAKQQVPKVKEMYDKKSLFGYIFGSVLGGVFAFLACLLMGLRVGGGYTYPMGAAFFIPIFLISLLEYSRENYRYKWKPVNRTLVGILEYLIAVLFTVIFAIWFARHVMTPAEKIVISAFTFACVFITHRALSRSDTYLKLLGDILGFKDFITVTEEDKIKFMLEEDPQLYYHILPYAQVLGVTDEWEKKFEKITMEPPYWYVGPVYSSFDCYIISRSLNRAVTAAMIKAAMDETNSGTRTGRSGGGGSFGGFGGGGHGGGGFGSR